MIINNSNKPVGVDGYFPITVNTADFKFNSTTVTENNKTYVLSKFTQSVGPLVPTPYPYYQVEPKDQITEGDVVLFQTSIKPEIPSTNAVQLGVNAEAETLDLADFLQTGENGETRNVNQGECLIYISKSETVTIVNYIYVQPGSEVGNDGYVFDIPASSESATRYYKHIQSTTAAPTSVPIGIRFIDTNNNNKLIFEIEDDVQENDGVGNIKTMISTSTVDFDFSTMDVEPDDPNATTHSINTKKEFKK